jgi:hypothetical protein
VLHVDGGLALGAHVPGREHAVVAALTIVEGHRLFAPRGGAARAQVADLGRAPVGLCVDGRDHLDGADARASRLGDHLRVVLVGGCRRGGREADDALGLRVFLAAAAGSRHDEGARHGKKEGALGGQHVSPMPDCAAEGQVLGRKRDKRGQTSANKGKRANLAKSVGKGLPESPFIASLLPPMNEGPPCAVSRAS